MWRSFQNSTRTDMSEYVDAASTSSMVQLTEDAVEEVMRRVVKVSTIGEVVKTTRVNSFVRDSILRVMKNNTNLDLKLKWLNNGSMDRKPGFVIQGTELKSLEDAISCVRFILKHSRRIETVTISMGVPDASLLDALVTVLIDAENVRLRELHMHRSYTSRSFLIISKLIEKNAASLKVIGKIGLSEACACMDSRINLERFSLHNFDLVKHGALESDALSAETTLCIEKLGSSGAVFKHLSYTTHSGFDLSKSVTTSMLVACKVESLRLTMSKGAPIPRRAHPNCSVQNLITLELIGDLITPDVSELFPNLKHFYFQRQDLIHGTKN
ncbi:hypothetical protein QR680_005808 [Steinernema hermaphroditum]|uniref:Uncharacterized protein n=1 Tax=Steinernema hermaphroditum TaxID=289476 RepID=A0AA39LWD1_9BILA|nr:hypothetical protein QR680_005808 [Steinernema hermaphroditum]